MKYMNSIAAGIALALSGTAAHAVPIVLDFEGVGDQAQVLDFYNGGTDSAGNSGVNYGASFGTDSLGLIDQDAGGTGNFANEPSPNTILFFLTGTAILNYAAGFDTGFSFFYSSSTVANVNVYDGLNGTGNLLGSIALAAQGFDNCIGDPNGDFCNWTAGGLAFAGVAKSIDFGGTTNQTGYDNITFGSSTPGQTPAPATFALLGLGLAGLGWAKRRRA